MGGSGTLSLSLERVTFLFLSTNKRALHWLSIFETPPQQYPFLSLHPTHSSRSICCRLLSFVGFFLPSIHSSLLIKIRDIKEGIYASIILLFHACMHLLQLHLLLFPTFWSMTNATSLRIIDVWMWWLFDCDQMMIITIYNGSL